MDGDNANNMPAHTAEWKTCRKIEGTFLSHNSQPSNIGKLQRSNILIFARDPKTQKRYQCSHDNLELHSIRTFYEITRLVVYFKTVICLSVSIRIEDSPNVCEIMKFVNNQLPQFFSIHQNSVHILNQ